MKNATCNLPSGWQWVSLKELCTFILDGTHGSPERMPGGIPLLSAKNIYSSKLWFDKFDTVTEKEYGIFQRRLPIRINDVLLTIVGSIGRSAVVEEQKPFILLRSVAVLRPKDYVDAHFLSRAFESSIFQEQLQQKTKKGSQPGIYLGDLASLKIPLPPLDEQRRIAAILHEKLITVEHARKLVEKQLQYAQDLRIAYLREKIDDEFAQKFPILTLADVCYSITDGTHVTPTYVPEGMPFLSVKDVKEKGISFNSCRYISIEEYGKLIRSCKPERDDVLYTKVGTTGIAKAVDTDREFSIFVSLALLKLKKGIVSPEYLERVLNSPFCRIQAENLTQGMANRNLVLKDLKRIKLPIPPLNEQVRASIYLKEKLDTLESIIRLIETSITEISNLFPAYLHQAFSGEL